MNPPDLLFWIRCLGVLAAEVGLAVGVASLVGRTIRSASLRRALWQGVLIIIGMLIVGEVFGLRGAWPRFSSWSMPDRAPGHRWVARVSVTEEPTVRDDSVVAPEEMGSVPAAVPPAAGAVGWPGWLWLSGAVAVGGRALLLRIWLARERSRGRVGDADSAAIIARLISLLGLKRVELTVWTSLQGPVAFGMFRPTVAVPADYSARFNQTQREAMLAHELAHLAGRDPVWLALADTVCALLWWHPGAWWARRQWRAASEQVADAAASLVPQGPEALAESLVILGRELSSPGPALAIGAAGSRFRSDLGRRVDSLLRDTPTWRPSRGRDRLCIWTFAALGVSVLMGLPLPGTPSRSVMKVVLGAARAEEAPTRPPEAVQPLPTEPVSPPTKPRSDSRATVGDPGPFVPGLSLELPVKQGGVKSAYVALREPSQADLLPKTITTNTAAAEPARGSMPIEEGKGLLTRTYRFDATNFMAAVRATEGVPASTNVQMQVRQFFSLCGVEFPENSVSNHSAIFFNDQKGILHVRALPAEQKKVEQALHGTRAGLPVGETSEPAVSLKFYFAEGTVGGPVDLGLDWVFGMSATNNPPLETIPLMDTRGQVEILRSRGQTAILSGSQFAALRQRLEERSGIDVLSAPEVTTISGRAARLQVAQAKTIVTGVGARVNERTEAVGFDSVSVSPTNQPGVIYHTETMYFGPVVEVLPDADGDSWVLSLTARVTEFLGYDDPGPTNAVIRPPTGKPLTATQPLPHLRHREMVAAPRVRFGEVVAMRGPMVEDITVQKGGLFRRASTNRVEKRLYAFVIPTPGGPPSTHPLSPTATVQPVVVRVLAGEDGFRVGEREVQEFELSGVLRSLLLARPGLTLLIREDPGTSAEKTTRLQDLARQSGIPNILLSGGTSSTSP